MASTQADYSCYVTIHNDSDSDLLLADFGIENDEGIWPLYQPLNTIEAHSTGRVHLKDRLGQYWRQRTIINSNNSQEIMGPADGFCTKSRLVIIQNSFACSSKTRLGGQRTFSTRDQATIAA